MKAFWRSLTSEFNSCFIIVLFVWPFGGLQKTLRPFEAFFKLGPPIRAGLLLEYSVTSARCMASQIAVSRRKKRKKCFPGFVSFSDFLFL